MPLTESQMRALIAKKCTSKCNRRNSFSRAMPTDWGPDAITNPRTGFTFTDASAWELISEILKSSHKVRLVTLKKPPGMKALEILYDFDNRQPLLYIKVHLGQNDIVIGRSFHLSTNGREK